MGQISTATRDELVGALAARYTGSNRKERERILDEFVAVSGVHRKHAMRLLRAGQSGQRSVPRPARRSYNHCRLENRLRPEGRPSLHQPSPPFQKIRTRRPRLY
jgi:hypothetical protein